MISRPWSFITERVPLRYKIHYRGLYNWFRGERELRLMKHVCQKDRIALDIGANLGIFSYFLRRHSRRCMAFEPDPDMVSILRTTYGNDIDIFPFALSDVAKEIAFRFRLLTESRTMVGRRSRQRTTSTDISWCAKSLASGWMT